MVPVKIMEVVTDTTVVSLLWDAIDTMVVSAVWNIRDTTVMSSRCSLCSKYNHTHTAHTANCIYKWW